MKTLTKQSIKTRGSQPVVRVPLVVRGEAPGGTHIFFFCFIKREKLTLIWGKNKITK
jgi:hypothetical protein